MGDFIKDLPSDGLPPTHEEKDMIQWMFKVKENVATPKFFLEVKSFFIIVLLYILLSNTYTDGMIQKILPITSKSSIFLLFLKSIIFAIILYLYFNYNN